MSSEWIQITWGEVATLEYGKALRDYQNAVEGFPVYGTNGPIGFHDTALCKTPGVVIGRKGAYRGVHYSPSPFFVIDTAFYLKPKAALDMRWAYFALLTCDINGMDSGSAIPSTSRDEFYKLPVLVPPLLQQVRIAEFLAQFDDRVTLLRETNATLEAIAQALFKSWFVDFDPVRAKMAGRAPEGMDEATAALFPDALEGAELGEVPKGWCLSNVGESFVLTMGQSPPGDTYNDRDDGLPFYQGRTDFGFRFPTQRVFCNAPTRIAEIGNTLVSVRAPVGDVNMAIEKCCIGRGVASVRHPDGYRGFTFYALRGLGGRFKTFDSEGTVFGSINKKDFQTLPVVDPGPKVLEAFEDISHPIDQRIVENEEQLRALVALRDTLLPRLISGQLRLPEAVQALPSTLPDSRLAA